jgi:hypothetical protein
MSTPNLALNQPAYNSSAWNTPLNANETILDNQMAGTTSIALTNANVTLSGPATDGSGQTQAMRITLTGAISANITITIPSGIAGRWVVYNTTSGTYTVTIASGGGGTTVVVPQGYNTSIYSDGTNIRLTDDGILAGGNLSTLTVAGTATFNGASTFNSTASFGSTTTYSGIATFNNTVKLLGSSTAIDVSLSNIAETITVSGSASSGTINFDVTTQSVLYYTGNSTANFTLNVRGNGSTTFNSLLTNGQAVTVVFLNTNGSTGYYNNVLTIDGTTVTPKWQGGVTPSSGNTNAVDAYTYTIIKTATSTYTVLGSLVKYV